MRKSSSRIGHRLMLLVEVLLYGCFFISRSHAFVHVCAPQTRHWLPASIASSGDGTVAEVGIDGRKATKSTFISPTIPATASVGELLDYLGDTKTRRRAARRLMKKPEEVPSDGLVDLVQATCRLGNTSGVQKLLAMMKDVGTPPDILLYETLLKLANTRFMWDLALALLREADKDGLTLTAAMLGSTLNSCLQADRPLEAVKLLKRFQRHGGIKPPVPLLMALISYLSEKGMVESLRQVSEAMDEMKIESDAALYTTLVGAFGRAGSYNDVITSAMMVEGRGITDKGRTYSTAVASLLEGNRMTQALELYTRSLADGAVITKRGYEVLVAGAAASSDPSISAFFFTEMKNKLPAEEGINAKVYWKPIVCCLKAGLLKEGAELVRSYYYDVEETKADPLPLNNLVKASCNPSQPNGREVALQVYQDIKSKVGFVGNSYTSMILIGTYRAKGDLDSIIAMHQDMLEAKVEVWLPAASNVMYAYAKKGLQEEELKVFLTLAASSSQTGLGGENHKATWERCLSRAMYLCAETKRTDVAATILELMQRSALRAGAKDYSNLIKTFSSTKRPEDALQVLQLMNKRKEKPSTFHYNAVLSAFAKADRMGDAERLFKEMKVRQTPLDATTFNMLISGFERQRQPERALEFYEEMTREGIKADGYLLSSLISVTADLRNRTLANSLLQKFRSMAGSLETDVMYGASMHAMAKADVSSRKEVLQMLEDYRAQGKKPNTIMYNEALYACYRLVRQDLSLADRALRYYNDMMQDGITPDAQTYRRLFKCLKQACRFEEAVQISSSLPREMLVGNDRIGMPVINSLLRTKDQAKARDLLSDLILKPNTSYPTLRWATSIYCTKLDPPDIDAAETILALVEERAWKADRGFYGFVLRGLYATNQIEKIFDLYFSLPESYQGGDQGGVATLAQIVRGRLDRVTGLLQMMRQQDDVASSDLMIEILDKLLSNEDYKIALLTVELMIDYDLTITKVQRRRVEGIVARNPKGPALEVMEGLSMLGNTKGAGEDDVHLDDE